MRMFKAAVFAASLMMSVAPAALAETPADVLVVAQNIDDIVSIDPAEAYEFSSGEYVTQTYDRLVQYDAPDVKKLAPGLASEWTVDDAAKTITFTLRDGVTFSSGNPLRGEDVVYSFKRVVVLNKAPAFILTQLGWTPENIDKMVTAEGNKVTVKYDGDFSSAFVLNVLAARPASVIDAETVKANEADGDFGNAWLKANSAGTGPFVLKAFRAGELLNLASNPNYFGGAPVIKGVIIRHVAEAATQQLMLQTGDVDMAKNLTPDQVSGLEGKDGVKVEILSAGRRTLPVVQPEGRSTAAGSRLGSRSLPRRLQGHDRQLPQGPDGSSPGLLAEGLPGLARRDPYSYDVEKAKKILADAGIKTPIKVTLDVINSTPFTDMAQSLQASFAEAGINFEIIPGTGSQVITKYRARTHEAMLLYWGPDFMDPHSNAKAFAYNEDNADDKYQSTTTWRNGWAVPAELNEATKAALKEADPAKRDALYVDLQRKVQEKSPIVIMFQAATQVAMKDKVEGYVNGAISDYVFYRLVKKN
ncbi:ABC transporter substrate-binding protein (plasmid) [Ensifer adhaerens]